MDAARWQRVEEIFAAASELPAERRAAYLAEACDGDDALREEVESLLGHHREDGFLVTGGASVEPPAVEDDGEALIGSRLGRFAVLSRLGRGGMGEVYLAHDPSLDRRVALKLLPAHLSRDPLTLRRFRREALAVSALNHPNIVTVHEVFSAGGREVLVSELVEGETLRERLRRGPLPVATAVDLARQVARGLQAAHRLGIVHRDVKPENLMLRSDGLVKLLDFGIAKSPPRPADGADLSQSPTHVLTYSGLILGTASYMSPEQARGEPATRQADVWALGCVLYEALTGKQAFPGRTAADVFAAILTREPDWEALPAATPWLVRGLLHRCLEKDPEARWQSVADVAEALRWVAEAGSSGAITGATAPTAAMVSAPARRRRRELLAWGLVALFAAGLAVAWWQLRQPARGPVYAALPIPPASRRSEGFQLSPDGSQIAWIGWTREGTSSLWVRRLAEPEGHELAGTTGAVLPFWSPDGRWLGYFADGKLAKVPAAGGPPQVLASAPAPHGGAWNRSGVIVFAPGMTDRLYRVSSEGGEPQPLTTLAPEEDGHRWPCFLPDGEHFAFLGDSAQSEFHHIRVGSLAGGATPTLVQAVSQPICAGDHLLYVHSGTLLVQRLDRSGTRLVGEPTALAEDIEENHPNHHFEVTAALGSSNQSGLLAFQSVDPALQFVWVDRRGRTVETLGPPGRYSDFDLSRDEQRLAYAVADADGRVAGIWWRDLRRGISTRLAVSGPRGVVGYPVWSPDGERVALGTASSGPWSAMVVAIGDPAPPRPLLAQAVDDLPASWSPDGSALALIRTAGPAGQNDLWVATPGDGRTSRFTSDESNETFPAFSPDGRWIAYVADPSGQREVYVRRYPEGGRAIQVSRAGGNLPAWRGDGREIYFVSPDHELVATPLTALGDQLQPGEPEVLFAMEAGERPRVWWEGVAPSRDGSRFLALEHVASAARQPLQLVIGWQPP